MIQAIRQKVHVQADGRLEIVANELQAGMEADVIVLVNESESDITRSENPSDLDATDRLSAIAQAQEIVRRHVPEGQSLVDELIQDRREASKRE